MINYLKNVILGLVASLALVAGAASAATYSVPASTTLSVSVSAGAFVDYFDFNLDNTSSLWSLGGAITSMPILFDLPAPFQDVTLPAVTFTGLELFNGTSLNPGAFERGYSFSPGTTFATNFWPNLADGNHFFKLTGTASGAYGVYAVALQAAPVPEPGEWAMILAGLGIIGVMARRRNANI